jgi:hypothetical protein
MSDFVFNIAKGGAAEKVRDDATKIGIMLLQVAESDAAMKDRTTLSDLLSGNTEANFTNYARKTSISGTLAVDNSADQVTLDIPDQTWASAGGGTNNTLAKLITYYDEGGTDGTRIPLTAHDFVVTTDGSDVVAQINSSGFYKAP